MSLHTIDNLLNMQRDVIKYYSHDSIKEFSYFSAKLT